MIYLFVFCLFISYSRGLHFSIEFDLFELIEPVKKEIKSGSRSIPKNIMDESETQATENVAIDRSEAQIEQESMIR